VAIKYYSSDGSDLLKSQTVTVGRDSLSGYELTADGEDFLGWATSSNSDTAKYLPLDPYTADDYASDASPSELNLYAVWETAAGTETHRTAKIFDSGLGSLAGHGDDDLKIDSTESPSGKTDVGASFSFGEAENEIAALPGASAQLVIYAYDVDAPEEVDTVYLVDKTASATWAIGKLSGMNNEWNTTVLSVPQSLFQSGHTYQLQITVSDGFAVYIRSAYLLLDGGDAANITDKSLSITLDSGSHPSATTSLTTENGATYDLEYKFSNMEDGSTVQQGSGTGTISTGDGGTGTDKMTWNKVVEKGTTYQVDVTIKKEGSPVTTITKTFEVCDYSYDLNGHGVSIPGGVMASGEKLANPADPKAEGFAFGGWYKERNCKNQWDFDTDTVNADTTLYALWNAEPTVSGVSVTSGSDSAAVSGSMAITFSEEMDKSAAGVVSLRDGSETTPLSGDWSADGKVYTVSYSDLAYEKEYTVQIAEFKSKTGAAMSPDNTRTFTTK
ncbi:InlB B-repeat-containing protein, partial [Oscillibacter sp.]|uniref:InlB B-repeat-containing protein n=1 Tax=Oscillibacter sp. TaxID=1945593 RepID=UPI0028B12962